MKVCIVSPYSPKSISGITILIEDMSRSLTKIGHEFALIAPKPSRNIKEPVFFKSNRNLIEIDIALELFKNLYLGIMTATKLLKKRKNVDIVHVHQPHMQCLLAAISSKIINKPVVTTYHVKLERDSSFLRRIQQLFLEKFVAKFSDKLVYVSKGTRDQYNFSGVIVRNGVDLKRFSLDINKRASTKSRLKINDDDVILIFSGRWTEDKGLYDLLIALHLVSKNNKSWKLLLLGRGDEKNRKKIHETIDRLKMKDNVIELGVVDHMLLDEYYSASDVFVLASHLEGLPMALLEAMACGAAPIVTDVGGIPEVVENGRNGYIIPLGDIEQLAKRIEWCLNNREDLRNIGMLAAETIREKFDIEKVAKEYVQVYESAMQGN